MKNLRKLGAVMALTFALGLPVLAGQTSTPPCPLPEPGQIETPPCASASGDMGTPAAPSAAPGGIGTPALTNNETSLTEIAADVLQNVLSLF
jgi:hypothetical protein